MQSVLEGPKHIIKLIFTNNHQENKFYLETELVKACHCNFIRVFKDITSDTLKEKYYYIPVIFVPTIGLWHIELRLNIDMFKLFQQILLPQ